jgi:hypothetical protein
MRARQVACAGANTFCPKNFMGRVLRKIRIQTGLREAYCEGFKISLKYHEESLEQMYY